MEFQKGMDLSFIPELEDAGVQVKDFDGTVMDPLDLVQKYGVHSSCPVLSKYVANSDKFFSENFTPQNS